MAALKQTKPATVLAFDREAIRLHVTMLHQLADGIEGLLVATVFYANPSGGADMPGAVTHHAVGDIEGMTDAIMAHDGVPNANPYIVPAVMRRDLPRGKKGSESDVVAVLALVADYDADTGHTGEMPVEAPYVIESSPGNYQHFVLLERPLSSVEAKPLAVALKTASGSDYGTADVSHTWRVPGCLNWPNKKKLDRGRPPEPSLVAVAKVWDGTITRIADLQSAVSASTVSTTNRAVVAIGELPNVDGIEASARAAELLSANDVGDRSAHAARVVEQLAFDGHSPEAAAALFLAATGNWLARYKDAVAMQADFERLWSKPIAQQHIELSEAGARMTAGVIAKTKSRPLPANDNAPPVAANQNTLGYPGIQSSGDFVRGFVPPDYHIDGVVQAGFLYSTTAMTGTGKTAVLLLIAALTMLGKPIGDREVRRGRVVYFAGENPDDVRMRWIAMAHHLDFNADNVDVHFIAGTFDVHQMHDRIRSDVEMLGGADMIVIDTSAAYFIGTDENSNVEMGKHARVLRRLTELPGKPVVFAACHPVKNADPSNLLPRGGGAFIAEVDGNLTLNKSEQTVKLHWQGKHRGPDFDPIHFELKTVTAPTLVDSKGRDVPTVMAAVVTSSQIREMSDDARKDEDEVLMLIENGSTSHAAIAIAAGWFDKHGQPHRRRVQSACDNLKKQKLVEFGARVGWRLTKVGTEAVVIVRQDRHRQASIKAMVTGSQH